MTTPNDNGAKNGSGGKRDGDGDEPNSTDGEPILLVANFRLAFLTREAASAAIEYFQNVADMFQAMGAPGRTDIGVTSNIGDLGEKREGWERHNHHPAPDENALRAQLALQTALKTALGGGKSGGDA